MDKKTIAVARAKEPADKKTAEDAQRDLESMLAAWHEATMHLEQTHEALREEVRRLNAELAARDRRQALDQRLCELGRMASRVAGQLHNSLVPASLNLSLLRRRIADDPIGLNLLGKIEACVTAVDATVNDLNQFAADRAPRWCAFALDKLVDEVLAPLAPQLDAQEIDAIIDVPKSQTIRGDRNMMRQALVDLVLNALDAMPDGGTLTVTSALTSQGLELEVADTGPGLPEEARDRVFEPFFTTKSSATGLGLSVVHRAVEAHGGYVTAMNCPEGGAAFTLCLPQRAMKAAA
ncbi:MAG: HAMP domain-containing histidine kinase [Pirellulales bacterium]|nr:HAMP domain-containing histidine kinase [Pirellulales bacterium]